jgi:argininosuccinate lyase
MNPSETPAAWSGRFAEPVDERVKRFTASIPFDWRLAPFDIQGSLAHAAMLHRIGVLSDQDLTDIQRGLGEILADFEAGRFTWNLDDEDIHFNIERALTRKVGDAGKRLHTARSRNDQVATDFRLWVRDAVDRLDGQVKALQGALLDLAEAHAATVMPGFTHLQAAQPVTFGHHLMAYVEMFGRDRGAAGRLPRRHERIARWGPPPWPAPAFPSTAT